MTKVDKKRLLDRLPLFDPSETKGDIAERIAEIKRLLIKMAMDGKPRPAGNLGEALYRYTHKNRFHPSMYDPFFTKEIKELRPDWMMYRNQIAEINREMLLEMARKGEPRPSLKDKLGRSLRTYIAKTDGKPDYPDFDRDIRRINPEWFLTQYERMRRNLFELARNGEPKPHFRCSVGRFLSRKICKTCKYYDHDLDMEIRRIRPDWFMTESDIRKRMLLEMAGKGESRPKQGKHSKHSKLARSLRYFLRKDPDFDRDIRRINPDWLTTKLPEVIDHKDNLMEMAKAGIPRPNSKKTKIGSILNQCACSSSGYYDPDFIRKIRRLAPHWFRKTRGK